MPIKANPKITMLPVMTAQFGILLTSSSHVVDQPTVGCLVRKTIGNLDSLVNGGGTGSTSVLVLVRGAGTNAILTP